MVRDLTADQVRAWIDPAVVSDVEETSESEAEFNLKVEVSTLPLHLIKEEPTGPLRIVGKCGFDTDRVASLLETDRQRRALLTQLGPVLVGTPGFYTFMDEEGNRCEFADLQTIQFEQRLYPDGLTQHALMNDVMAVAKGMRHVQNAVSIVRTTEVE